MLYLIKDINDPLVVYLKDDPVRPHIPISKRFDPGSQVLVLKDHDRVGAIVCAKLCERIPINEQQLLDDNSNNPTSAIFYTIWSYQSGFGQRLIREGIHHIRSIRPDINRFVTLSPVTEIARKFHIRNGAVIFRINADTINYEYLNI